MTNKKTKFWKPPEGKSEITILPMSNPHVLDVFWHKHIQKGQDAFKKATAGSWNYTQEEMDECVFIKLVPIPESDKVINMFHEQMTKAIQASLVINAELLGECSEKTTESLNKAGKKIEHFCHDIERIFQKMKTEQYLQKINEGRQSLNMPEIRLQTREGISHPGTTIECVTPGSPEPLFKTANWGAMAIFLRGMLTMLSEKPVPMPAKLAGITAGRRKVDL